MSINKPQISVIIPTYNRSSYLVDALQSILEGTTPPDDFEILVIDNNSTDDTRRQVQKIADKYNDHQIRHVLESNQGASFSRNRGIAEATAPLLLFMDDDEIADPNLIKSWLSFFRKYPNAMGGGGQIKVRFEDPRPEWMSHFLMPLLGEHRLSSSIQKYPLSQFPFAGNMAYRREVFEEYGNLKTNLGRKGGELLAGEEKEFYQRLRRQTDQIYHVPEAVVYHRVDQPRMTRDFIKKQALGLGQTIHLMLENESIFQKAKKLGSELFKTAATLLLFLGYNLILQYPKAKMLVKFRWWIWQGYRDFKYHPD